jgi:hypothetical protein
MLLKQLFTPIEVGHQSSPAAKATVLRTRLQMNMTDKTREEVFMEGPIEPNTGPSLADVLLCTFESTNAGFSPFPVRKLLD